MVLLLLVLLPVVIGLLTWFIDDVRIDLVLLLLGAVCHLGLTATVGFNSQMGGSPGSLFAVDQTALLFLAICSILFFLVSLYTVQYILYGTHDEQDAPHRFVPCLLWFLAAMTLVCVTQHLALQWAAIEATTLASAPLVYFYKRKEALEAAWKYLLICSVGIALALLGVFFLGIAASTREAQVSSLQLVDVMRAAPTLSRTWLRASFALALVGFGTKMGLAPMHTWLPDTHSQAPSPVSALLSGALLNCALLAILRFFQVCIESGDAEFARNLLLVFGFTSLVVACVFMIGQHDYKRLLAYSSIENMGIIAIGIGLGGAATRGAMLHCVNHSLCKAGLFMLAGNVLREYGTTNAEQVRGLFRRLPTTGGLFMALLVAIGGVPPFGTFVSEWLILQTAMNSSPWLAAGFALLVALAFVAMVSVALPMLQGKSGQRSQPFERRLAIGAPIALLAMSFVLGIYIPPFVERVTRLAAGAMGG
jgi:hydrogenase-4 component F